MSLTSGTARTTPARAVTSGAPRSRQARTSTDPVWRVWITRHRVGAAILAGIVATHMATIIGFFLPAVGLPKLDWPSANGGVFTPYGSGMQHRSPTPRLTRNSRRIDLNVFLQHTQSCAIQDLSLWKCLQKNEASASESEYFDKAHYWR